MRYPFEYCQECGEQIGWTGRFFQFLRIPLHKCYDPNKPYKPRIVVHDCGASEWVNSTEYFLSDEGQKFLKETSEFAKRYIKKNDRKK